MWRRERERRAWTHDRHDGQALTDRRKFDRRAQFDSPSGAAAGDDAAGLEPAGVENDAEPVDEHHMEGAAQADAMNRPRSQYETGIGW